jgi:hypothetical protein
MLVNEIGTLVFCFALSSSWTTFCPLTCYLLYVSTSRTWTDCPRISTRFGFLAGPSATSQHNNAQPIPSCNANHHTFSCVGQPVAFWSPKDCREYSGSWFICHKEATFVWVGSPKCLSGNGPPWQEVLYGLLFSLSTNRQSTVFK